jgi:hypothetical protein
MSDVGRAIAFACRRYGQPASTIYAGYMKRDPLALLRLRPGRASPYLMYDRIRAGGSLVPEPPALMYRSPSLTNVYVRPYYGMHDNLGLGMK